MSEELQGLLERIRKDGVEKGRSEAERLVAEARERAAKIVEEAEAKAARAVKDADAESKAFVERGEHALEQAARDTVLSVREAVHETLRRLVAVRVEAALDEGSTRELIKEVVGAFAGREGTPDVVLPEALRERIGDALIGELRGKMEQGIELRGERGLRAGFRISIREEHVEFDFSDQAIVEALCRVVRPKLARLLEGSTEEEPGKG